MKITKTQLRKIIKEELEGQQSPTQGQRDAELFQQIEEHMKLASQVYMRPELWAPGALDKIEQMLRTRKAVPKGEIK